MSAGDQTESADVPLISIITPCLNRVQFVREAISSIQRQGYPRVEHIIMDGGSTDGTLDVIREFRDIRLVSRPDQGSHDAMNRGLALATGDIVGFLNTDDMYADGILWETAKQFSDNPTTKALCATPIVFEADAAGQHQAVAELAHFADDDLLWVELMYGAPGFNSWFFDSGIFEDGEPFDTAFPFAADREFLMRLVLRGIRPTVVARTGYYYRRHEQSATIDPGARRSHEILEDHLRIVVKHLRNPALTPEIAKRFKEWKAFETYRTNRLVRRRGRLCSALAPDSGAFGADPFMLAHLIRAVAARWRLSRRLHH